MIEIMIIEVGTCYIAWYPMLITTRTYQNE
jgi:hypothetical protein